MLSLWNLCLLLPLSLPLPLPAENVEETQHPDGGAGVQHLTQPSQRPRGAGLVPGKAMFGAESVDALLSRRWPLSEEAGRQGVMGEYADIQETALLYGDEEGRDAGDAAVSEERGTSPEPDQEQLLVSEPTETSTTNSTHTRHKQTTAHQPSLLAASPPSLTPQQDSTSPSAGPGPGPDDSSDPGDTGSAGWTANTQEDIQGGTVPGTETQRPGDAFLHRGAVVETEKDGFKEDLLVSKASGPLLLDGNTDTTVTPCKTSNQSWTPVYPDDFTPEESQRPSLALSFSLFIPLYSDWNSALATWGFAWEAHIYGLGSVFTVLGLISVVCLLGVPLRCPLGSPYITLLHLFLLAFVGTQAFCLLYDAYSHQDRLPLLSALLLSQLPFPCLISTFSLAFLLLSLRSRMRLSLPLAISTSFSALPKPCLLLCMSLLHFGVSLGCIGLLKLFHSLPAMILLIPQCVFVCLTVFLSCSYLIFYCLIQADTKHIYRLNDNGESGGSPEVMQPPSCPFAKVEDWGRAAGAGVGASLCLLGCGGLQFYGILHALGLGGVDGYGFQPWPWWGYQVGCRLCEVGVCLGLSLIGTHPLFCQNNSNKSITPPWPGSWTRLSCSSPSRVLTTLPSQSDLSPPLLSSNESWSQGKQDKLVVCDVIPKGQSETLPLCSMVDPSGNGIDCVPKFSQTWTVAPSLPTPPSPPHRSKDAVKSQLSSMNSLGLETDSTVDLRPPSPINLSRSIDQALFSESLFSHSIFGLPRMFHTSSSLSLSSPSQVASKHRPSSVENTLFRTSSCGNMDPENTMSNARPSQPHGSLVCRHKPPKSPVQLDWKGSVSGSTQGLWNKPKETGKLRSYSWTNRGQNFTQSSLPRAIPHLSYHRHYRTLSLASQDSQGSGRLAGTQHLSESKQLEWDAAVQAEFVNVCRQIDTLSICSDTIEL